MTSPYHYQDIWTPVATTSGERSCEERWGYVSAALPEVGVMLDVGSNVGYYSIRSAVERPELLVVSLEADPSALVTQQSVLGEHQIGNVCCVESTLDAATATAWSQSCDLFDLTLVLSVAHWFDDPAVVLERLSSMSAKMLVELPDVEDHGACGQGAIARWGADPRTWLEGVTGRTVRLLGRTGRHTSDARGHMLEVSGDVRREPSVPYIGGPRGSDRHAGYSAAWVDGEPVLEIRGARVDRSPAVNIANLMAIGRLWWPTPRELTDRFREELEQHPGHLDPGAHNVLLTASATVLIDGDDISGSIRFPLAAFRSRVRAGWRSAAGLKLKGTPLRFLSRPYTVANVPGRVWVTRRRWAHRVKR